jgi:hypothetical protein
MDGHEGFTNWIAPINYTTTIGISRPGTWSWDGPICEILICVTALSDSDRRKVEGYLAHKWWGPGLLNELPYGHPWKDTPPTV